MDHLNDKTFAFFYIPPPAHMISIEETTFRFFWRTNGESHPTLEPLGKTTQDYNFKAL